VFFHTVLFEIKPREVLDYRRDSKMWARHAKQAKGFINYFTMKRSDASNQYASVYQWRTKKDHERFMQKLHDWLVSQSKAKVKVLGYYQLQTIDRVRNGSA